MMPFRNRVLKKVEMLQALRRMMMMAIPLKIVMLKNNHRKRKLSPRRETRSSQVPSSPLTPPKVQPPISRDDEPYTSKKPSSKVSLNNSKSNIIGDLDECLHLRKKPSYSVNHVTYHCYLAQFEPKKVEEGLQDENWVYSMH